MEIRPRFNRVFSSSPEELIDCLSRELKKPDAPVKGLIIDRHIILEIPPEEQHYWSPRLSLDVEEHPEGALIRGLYGPRPSVWMMFVFFYALLGFISMVILIIGLSQWNLGLPAGILWVLPLAAVIFTLVYYSARTGQKLGHDQMVKLQAFLDKSLGEVIK